MYGLLHKFISNCHWIRWPHRIRFCMLVHLRHVKYCLYLISVRNKRQDHILHLVRQWITTRWFITMSCICKMSTEAAQYSIQSFYGTLWSPSRSLRIRPFQSGLASDIYPIDTNDINDFFDIFLKCVKRRFQCFLVL